MAKCGTLKCNCTIKIYWFQNLCWWEKDLKTAATGHFLVQYNAEQINSPNVASGTKKKIREQPPPIQRPKSILNFVFFLI